MSRYPAFGRRAYDESLLQIAPEITKADRQEGYSVDILERGGPSNFYGSQFGPSAPRRQQQAAEGYEQPRSRQTEPPQQPVSDPNDDISALPSLEKVDYYSGSNQQDIYTIKPYTPPKKKPWYRTALGLVILAIVILVLAGAGVGIAVGVIVAKNKANADQGAQQQQQQQQSGASSSARAGSTTTANETALPSYQSLDLVSLDVPPAPAAAATSQANLALTIRPNPAVPAVSAAVKTVAPAPTPGRVVTRTAVGPTSTPSVDPICARFPTLPSCRQR